MPHFVVSEFHGREVYAVEWSYSETTAANTKRWPPVKAAIEIPECVACLGLGILELIYKGYKADSLKPTAISAPQSEIDLLYNIATVLLRRTSASEDLRKVENNAHQTD